MVALIDMNSEVRHECFHTLADAGVPVKVFHSSLTFVDSGAFFDTDLLILGKTHCCRTKCEVLRWASSVRPGLKTLLLKPEQLTLRTLADVCDDPGDELANNDSPTSLYAFRTARALGLLDM